jgi:CspA family cold shock protein
LADICLVNRAQLAHFLTASIEETWSVPTGIVKWFNGEKGYGFIKPDDGSPDVFVHISALERAGLQDLQDGQKIEYELSQSHKTGKWTADNLEIL